MRVSPHHQIPLYPMKKRETPEERDSDVQVPCFGFEKLHLETVLIQGSHSPLSFHQVAQCLPNCHVQTLLQLLVWA